MMLLGAPAGSHALYKAIHRQNISAMKCRSIEPTPEMSDLQAKFLTSLIRCVCLGTMRVPHNSGLDSIAGWERGFFESEFTHASGASRLTTFRGGFVPLFQSLAGSKARFPSRYLTEARETLGQFVERR